LTKMELVYILLYNRLYTALITLMCLKMETTIKHAEEERGKAVDSARSLYEEMQMLKEEVDAVRSNIGLERLPDSEANNKIVQK